MCYVARLRCVKHGSSENFMEKLWEGNKQIFRCTEPGCTNEIVIQAFNVTIPGTNTQAVNYKKIKDTNVF